MAWYSYFLLSFPEAFFMIVAVLTLFSISIKKNFKSILLFALIYGGITFSLSMFMQNSLKPLVGITAFALLAIFIFHLKVSQGFILSIVAVIFLVIFEIVFLITFTQIFSVSFDQIASSPWLRIGAGVFSLQMPFLILILIINKFNLRLRLPFENKRINNIGA